MKRRILLFLIGLLLAGVCGCADSPPLSRQDFILDTVVTVTLYDTQNESILEDCMDLCRSYEQLLSRTVDGGDIGRLNHAGGASVEVSPETAELIASGLRYGDLSGGRFDITIEPLSALWDFSSEDPRVPSDAEIREARARVDYRRVVVMGRTVTTPTGAGIDLGGIAKGYIADRMADFLRERRVRSALIDLGGNIVAVGQKPSGQDFVIGIRSPFNTAERIGYVRIGNRSVVTSGAYERFFEQDGVRYHHILDPATGYPAQTDLASVTVLSGRSVDGDALSTCCFMAGLREGREIIEATEGAAAVFVTTAGEVVPVGDVTVWQKP